MSDSTRVERRLTDEERIKKVQEDARKSKYQREYPKVCVNLQTDVR